MRSVLVIFIYSVVSVGQSLIDISLPSTGSLGDGREVWLGYRQTAKLSGWKTVLLNVDRTCIHALCTVYNG